MAGGEEKKMEVLEFVLDGCALLWWDANAAQARIERGRVTWEDFRQLFQKLYFCPAVRQARSMDLLTLRQGSMNIDEYQQRFIDLIPYSPHIDESDGLHYRFHPDEGESWYFYGEGARPPMPLVSALRECHVLESGGEGYLIYRVDMSTSSPSIDQLLVVSEFPDVIPNEIPVFPPVRELEFCTDLIPGTTPISRASYHLEPSEMRELKQQLQDLLDKGYICPSVSPNDHEQHLRIVLQTLREKKLHEKLSKCKFWLDRIVFLSHLTRKDIAFTWYSDCEDSFHKLRRRLTSTPVLALPSGSRGYIVYTDSSGQGLRCVLTQSGHVIAYASRQLKMHEVNYPIHDLE
ncbi:uncharacterized protein [Henckelia pumila]|uniref:uncharacterized protein n=1 Tax=Henckelia pumila TaxID=405737 RepID=UPI003C6E26FA